MNWDETKRRLIAAGKAAEKLDCDCARWADLRWANLREANLRGADLRGADLRWADLRGADLREANLRGADLRGADLRGADLRGADLRGADLRGADLREADLRGVVVDYETIGLHPAPEGDLIVWGNKSGHIVKARVPTGAPRSCATTRKHRSAWVEVLEIDDGAVNRIEHKTQYGSVIYEVGKETHADSWDTDRWNECSRGIHWFLSRAEAEAWQE
ncbi:MAG: pentapeptide repeat-containing protein [Candidatus Omnitrophica bacterium]|nr:pentapeptide repeat-containing protein [Candidatus Omnitrophota bacterium]